jgi:acyl-CoA synthetase (AMP-forming)/AMP-acid ligase II
LQFAEHELEGTVLDRFRRVVERFPNKTAIYTESRSFTYEMLAEAANRVADAISEAYDEADVPVAILMEHGALPIVALLAVLKSGHSFVMLDSMNPTSWLSDVLQDSLAQLILTDSQQLVLAAELAPTHQLLDINEALDRFPGNIRLQTVATATPLAIYYLRFYRKA